MMGEVSAGWHAFDGAAVAPGTQDILNQSRRRPQVQRELNLFTPDHDLFDLFTKNLKCARRGAAGEGGRGGESSMTAEHIKPTLDNTRG